MDEENDEQIRNELICSSPLSNYYGTVELRLDKNTGRRCLVLDNWNGADVVFVSDELADAFEKEFGKDYKP